MPRFRRLGAPIDSATALAHNLGIRDEAAACKAGASGEIPDCRRKGRVPKSGKRRCEMNRVSIAISCASSFLLFLAVFFAAVLAPLTNDAIGAGGTAKGTIKLKDKTVEVKYAYLIKAPDPFDNSKTVSTVIITPNDISQTISECQSGSCASGITEGMTVGKEDFGGTIRVVYWVVTKDGMMQYSGNDDVSALVLTTDTADRMAGKLTIDDSAAEGPKIDVEFDAPLAKEFKE
jgi:hypothetical protein